MNSPVHLCLVRRRTPQSPAHTDRRASPSLRQRPDGARSSAAPASVPPESRPMKKMHEPEEDLDRRQTRPVSLRRWRVDASARDERRTPTLSGTRRGWRGWRRTRLRRRRRTKMCGYGVVSDSRCPPHSPLPPPHIPCSALSPWSSSVYSARPSSRSVICARAAVRTTVICRFEHRRGLEHIQADAGGAVS
jgi:hypothetical protein